MQQRDTKSTSRLSKYGHSVRVASKSNEIMKKNKWVTVQTSVIENWNSMS